MATTRGSWRLDEAVRKQWFAKGIDTAFRQEWVEPTAEQYDTLHDQDAEPSCPGPYCTLMKWEPEVLVTMSGQDQEYQLVRWTFELTVHARNKTNESAKSVARRLAEKVAAAFDPHNAIQIEGALHVSTERGPDWDDVEGEDEHAWHLEFSIVVEATIDEGYEGERSSSSQTESRSSRSSQSSESSVSSSSTLLEEDDDVLDFADIGGVYDSSAAAVANTSALETYLAFRVNDSVMLRFGGPRDYNQKRQPGVAVFDLSGGPIQINVGAAGGNTHVLFEGPSKITGINAATATTPIFEITRAAGTMPMIRLHNIEFESDGSVLKLINGGSGLILDGIRIANFTGSGAITHDSWDDIDNETASYGVWLVNADGCTVKNLQIRQGSGHGFVCERLHAGDVSTRIQHCAGAGHKVQLCNGTRAYWWAEHCDGYGLHVRDTGVNRYSGGAAVADIGKPNDWQCSFEGNNGRDTSVTKSGHSFSQFKFENVARTRMLGHSGWRSNMARLDRFSRVRCDLIEEMYLDPSQTPDLELVTNYLVDGSITMPGSGADNWSTIWTNASYRPTAAVVGAGTENDPERIRITWPIGSYNNTAVQDSAYWRPFNSAALSSPATFFYTAQVQSVDGNIPTYCNTREAAGSTRQRAFIGAFTIDPVAGAVTGFPLWDTNTRWFSGSIKVDDTRSDISPAFNAFINGMQDLFGGGQQTAQHQLDILQLRLYRIT